MPIHLGLQIPPCPLDRVVVDEVLSGKAYPPPPLKPGEPINLVVDIGAHVGAAAVYFHELWPAAHVVCYEPSPSSFALLKRNAPFAELHRFALGRHDGDTLLSVEVASVTQSLYAIDLAHKQAVVVDVKAAGNALALLGQPDVIKLDTEGAEVEIMKSAPHIFDAAKVVYVEYHRWQDRMWIDWLQHTHILFAAKIDYSPNVGELAYIHKDAIDPKVLASHLLPE